MHYGSKREVTGRPIQSLGEGDVADWKPANERGFVLYFHGRTASLNFLHNILALLSGRRT
jgi:hypothetical protein